MQFITGVVFASICWVLWAVVVSKNIGSGENSNIKAQVKEAIRVAQERQNAARRVLKRKETREERTLLEWEIDSLQSWIDLLTRLVG